MIFIIFCIIIVYLFLNLGNFMDITGRPKQADIIVALGGDHNSGCRLKKAVSLYREDFSKSKIFIYTGSDSTQGNFNEFSTRKQYLLAQNIKNKNIFHADFNMVVNTMEEVLFIKKYMLHYNYKSVLFVSHPQHSRRIITLANFVADYKEAGLRLSVVSCNPDYWNKGNYYTNKISLMSTLQETMKLIYNITKYNFLLIKYTIYSKYNKDLQWDNILKKTPK